MLEPPGDVGPRGAEALCLRHAPAARARRRAETSGCSRRPAKGASASRSPAAFSTRRAAASVSTRWRCSCDRRATIVGLLEHAFDARGHPGLVRSRHAAAPSVGPRVPRDPELRGRTAVGRAVRRVPVALAGARTRPPRSRQRTSRRRPTISRRVRRHRAPRPTSPSVRRREPDRRRVRQTPPVVDGTLRAPWKWERLIVESAVIGGDPERWHRRLAGLRRAVSGSSQRRALREDPDSPRLLRLERDAAQPRASSRVRAADHRRARVVAGAGDVGRVARPLRSAGAAGAAQAGARPARARRAAPMGASARSRSKRRATCCAIGCATFDEHPPADRYGRVFVGSPHQARGRAFRVVFVPGLAERMFPQKPREDPMLLDAEMRTPLDAGLARAGRSRQDGTSAAAARRRRRDRTAVALVPADRRRRRAAARAVVLRARRHARDHRAHPEPRGSAARGRRPRGGRATRLAGAGAARQTRSTTSSTISRRCAS